jgi:hypothetical protein
VVVVVANGRDHFGFAERPHVPPEACLLDAGVLDARASVFGARVRVAADVVVKGLKRGVGAKATVDGMSKLVLPNHYVIEQARAVRGLPFLHEAEVFLEICPWHWGRRRTWSGHRDEGS